ncbi:MAG: hypothetical protein HOK20_04735, partial [Alphaproteobacteria bacterium]|nr:hypothetical protein [Alphaproteobacteria bacterium]
MDFIQPFLVSTGGIDIQGRLIRLEGALDRILTQHQYPEPISFLLADFIILTVALGCGVKSDGKISAHIKGIGGPVSLMAVDFFTDGSLRGYAQFDSEKISALQKDGEPMDVFSLFRKGHLVFTVDQKGSKEQYQEIVMLHGATLVETLLHYFEQTHQFDVALKAMTGHHSKWRSGCLFLQKLSNDEITEFLDESENGWDQATARVGAISDESLLNFDPKPQEYLREFFPDE